MPIYEYRCDDCGHAFEALQKISEDPLKDCPSCETGSVSKLISRTSFVLKGGGWYKDHYGLKADSGSDTPSASEPSPSAPSSSAPSSTEAASSTKSSSDSGSP